MIFLIRKIQFLRKCKLAKILWQVFFIEKIRKMVNLMRYGSAKINAEIIEKMLKDKISGNEISCFILFALHQDAYGRVFNVKYKDVCKDIEISTQGYYNCLEGLAEMNYIRIINRNYTMGWDLEILNNTFATEFDDKKRYLNINRDVFFCREFLRLKANEKKILMKVMLEYRPERDYYINIVKLGEWIGISNMQLLRSYIEKIKEFFKIGHKKKNNKGNKVIIFQRGNYEIGALYQNKTIFYHYTKFRLKAMLRRYKVKYTYEEMEDLIILVKQYREHFGILSQTIIDTVAEKRSIQPKLINYIVSKRLNPQT